MLCLSVNSTSAFPHSGLKMDPGEVFRRFFGLPPRPRQPDSFHDSSTWRNRIPDEDDQGHGCCCDDDNDEDEISFFFGNSPNR